jgi:hypothetical protein
MVTADRFAQGMTPKEYLDQMSMNRERMIAAFNHSAIRPEDLAVLDRYRGTRKILAITEDWCGTSIGSLPHVMKLAEAAPDVELRIFLRDENPDLMDQYLKAGVYRSIPVYAFFDEQMRELARFIERRPA